jgi:hypothetical protein
LGTDKTIDAAAERRSHNTRHHECKTAEAGTPTILRPTLNSKRNYRRHEVHDAGLGRANARAAALAGEGFMVIVVYLEDAELWW